MAETINGIEFDIPESWTLTNEESADDSVQKIYVSGNEVICFYIQSIPEDSGDLTMAYNLMLFDCESIYGDKDGFFLMSDDSNKSDEGYLTRIQECVYYENFWNYVYLVAKNTGTKLVSLLYYSPTQSNHLEFDTFVDVIQSIF